MAPQQSSSTWKTFIANTLCDTLENFLVLLAPSKDSLFLTGAFAPVSEGDLSRDIEYKGTLPSCLNGEFVRTGPNPKFKPTNGYHWFDGDGMLHGVRIKDGKVNYVNRYVRTSRLKQEEAYKASKFLKIGDLKGFTGIGHVLLENLRVALGVLDKSNGYGTANTSLVFHGGRLLVTQEADAPYAVKVLDDGELETLGRNTYGGVLDHAFTAHPKVDPATGEMFTFGYNVDKAPYVSYRVVSKEGLMGDRVDITIPRPVLMHDFAITENYAVFIDTPLVLNPSAMIKTGFPFEFDPSIPARFGILPRYAKTEALIKWFTLPSHSILHTANAWEEGEEVVLIACHIPFLELSQVAKEEQEVKHISTLHEYRFNLVSGEASMKQLADFFSDFPRINESFVGRKQRYVYCSVMRVTKVIGVAKYDLTESPKLEDLTVRADESWAVNRPRVGGTCVGLFEHGSGRFGSEPVFVPSGEGGDEDDGYLLNFVHDEVTGISEVVVVDAKTMAADPVAIITIPRRMPYGFHGTFISENQLKAQVEK